MKEFDYRRASDASEAVALLAANPEGRYLGGGTNLVDLMKTGVESPGLLVYVRGLPFDEVRADGDASFVFGSAVKHPYPLVLGDYSVHTSAQALEQGEAEIVRIGERLRARGRV